IPFVQIPTTLLAQVDSSVGGKTGINSPSGKNLIGAFHQPIIVLADNSALATLPRRQRVAGYAEIVKSGLIADPDLFAWCEDNGGDVLSGDPAALAEAVRRACVFKAAVVAADEKEQAKQNGRALLNLGHTFGHAIEAELGYDGRILHGEAVSIGLHLAMALSVKLGHAPEEDLARLDSHLRSLEMPTSFDWFEESFSAQTLLDHMTRDKKMQNGRISFVLLHGIGKAFTSRDVPMESVRNLLINEGCQP
ncbi:3-dehydroquinate synthase, partial [Gluconobacter japonicus]